MNCRSNSVIQYNFFFNKFSWAATLGTFLWNRNETGWLNQHIFKAIPKEEMIKYNYSFWLMNTAMENMNNDNKHGIVMQHVTEHVFGHFSVPLPPLPEQQNIAFILNSKCNTIAELIFSIVSLQPFKPEIIHYDQKNTAYRVTLTDYCDHSKNQFAQRKFEKQCEDHGISIRKKTRYTVNNIIYRIVIQDEADMKAVCSMVCVSSIESDIPLQMEPLELESVRYMK